MSKNKKELKSLIVSNTLIFVFVMVLVNLFIGVFKEENLLVGIMSIALMLVCLSIDLTIHPIKSSLYLIGFNVSLGLLAFLVSQNVILGLSINFAVMAFIGYYFSFEFIKPINMLVGLHYIFLVAKPVSSEQLPLRLMALVVGALMIMCVQLLVNNNKLVKCRAKYINSICNSLLEKIDLIKAKEDTDKIDSDINSSINNLKSIIFASGKNNYCIAEYSVNAINILASLEKINTILDNLNKVDLDFLDDVTQVIKSINAKDSDFHVDLINLENKYEDNLSSLNVDDFINIYDFIVTIKTLKIELNNYNKVHKEEKNLRNKFLIPHNFKDLYSNKNLLNLKSTRACYGLRLGLLVSVSFFIVHYFNIPFGEWAVYTVFALCQPHFEYTIVKSKKRILGTFIGVVSITILFNIFTDPMIRTVILLISGYLMAFMNDYRNSVIFTTICAIAAATVAVSNPNPIIFSRVVFVIIGIILSIIANKYILPGSLKDEEENINNIQKMASTQLFEEILNSESYKNTGSIKILSLVPALIDLRINYLNVNGLNMEKNYLDKNKILMNDVYMIHLLLKNDLNYYLAIDTVKNILLENDTMEVMKAKVDIALDYTSCLKEKFILYKFSKMLDVFSNEWFEDNHAYELSTVLN